jgi:hypothetical protein
MNYHLPPSLVHALKDAAETTAHTVSDFAHTAHDLFEDSPVAAALPMRRRPTGPSPLVKAAGVVLVVGLTATAVTLVLRARHAQEHADDDGVVDHLRSVDAAAPVNV